jgi:hypothetical protein
VWANGCSNDKRGRLNNRDSAASFNPRESIFGREQLLMSLQHLVVAGFSLLVTLHRQFESLRRLLTRESGRVPGQRETVSFYAILVFIQSEQPQDCLNGPFLFQWGEPDMYRDKKVVVVMPAYNAAKTLRQTCEEVRDQQLVDTIILVDDNSRDETVPVARTIEGLQVHVHEVNKGYGGNQKSCYRLALEAKADIVIMIHPDYQYTPLLIPAMVSIIGNGLHPCVLGSRILGGYALKGGMPLWKYISNRVLTFAENILLGAKLSEYHTGYRAFSRTVLESLDLSHNSDDFVFDNQMLAQILWNGFSIAEVSCPTKYFAEASSINLRRSIRYGFGCLSTGLLFRLSKMGVMSHRLFPRR